MRGKQQAKDLRVPTSAAMALSSNECYHCPGKDWAGTEGME